MGRDPETLELTVGQIVTFPGLAGAEEFSGEGERFVFSTAEELAEEWREFASQGVRHLVVWPMPYDAQCIERVTAALRSYRDGNGR